MIESSITRIEIDDQRRLRVFPAAVDSILYTSIYRAGAEIVWDKDGYFHSPPPREWSYARWLEQIVSAVRGELGVRLTLDASTEFSFVHPNDVDSMRACLTDEATPLIQSNSFSTPHTE